jgi:dihydroflavonol-4-reductase
MAYLITGATGFLGRHLLTALQQSAPSTQHCVLVRRAESWAQCPFAATLGAVHVIEGSLTDPTAWQDDPRLKGIDGIFHLAAMVQHSRHDAAPVYAANVAGTCHLVGVAAHHGVRLVYVSTSGTVGVFDRATDSADEHAPLCEAKVRQWPYYHSKVQAEQQATALAKTLGVEMVTVRPPMMLGPGDHRFRATGQVVRFLRGRLPFVVDGGIHYVDIRDAATAMTAAMLHPKPRAIYNLPGTACSIVKFFKDVGAVANRRPPALRLPYKAAWGAAALSAWVSRQTGYPAFFPDPVVSEMAAHYWGVHSHYAADELQFVSRAGRETLGDTVAWIRAHRADC